VPLLPGPEENKRGARSGARLSEPTHFKPKSEVKMGARGQLGSHS
jgi:hypothetical protein